jgi:spore coat protein U-like protein
VLDPPVRPAVSTALSGLLALALAAAGRAADAATAGGQFSISASVVDGCAVSGANMDFGTYTAGQEADLDAVGRIEYAGCSGTVRVEIDGGQRPRAGLRHMSSGSNQLGYQLYQDQGRTRVWGTGSDAVELDSRLPGVSRVNIYGRIPRGLSVMPGRYTDQVNIMLVF